MSSTTINSFCERCGKRTLPEPVQAKGLPGLVGRVRTAVGGSTLVDDGLRLCLGCRGYVCASCMNDLASVCLECAPVEVIEALTIAPDWPDVAVAEPEPEPEAEPVAVAEPEPEAEPVAVAEPEPEAEPVAVAEPVPAPAYEIPPVPVDVVLSPPPVRETPTAAAPPPTVIKPPASLPPPIAAPPRPVAPPVAQPASPPSRTRSTPTALPGTPPAWASSSTTPSRRPGEGTRPAQPHPAPGLPVVPLAPVPAPPAAFAAAPTAVPGHSQDAGSAGFESAASVPIAPLPASLPPPRVAPPSVAGAAALIRTLSPAEARARLLAWQASQAPVAPRSCHQCDLPISTRAAFCRRCGSAQPRVA